MIPIDKHIGLNLQRERNRRRLSVKELARMAGLTEARIQSFECGIERISAVELYALSGVLDVPVSVFFEVNDNDNKEL